LNSQLKYAADRAEPPFSSELWTAFHHRRRHRQSADLSGQTSLTEKLIRAEDRNHGFLALIGKNDDLYVAFYDITNRV
jgi:hypothetical protein